MRSTRVEEEVVGLERPVRLAGRGSLLAFPERPRPFEPAESPPRFQDAVAQYLQDLSRIPLPGPGEQQRMHLRLDRARREFRSCLVGSPLALAETARVLRDLQRGRVAYSRVFQAGRGALSRHEMLPRLSWILRRLRALQAEARAASRWLHGSREPVPSAAPRLAASRARWSSALLSLDLHPDVFRAMLARQEALSRTMDGILREAASPGRGRGRLRRMARALRAEAGESAGSLRRRLRTLRARAAEFEQARADLAASHLRLVVSIARRHPRSRSALPDLIQEGNLGLLKAVERFDPRLGFSFSTYAKWWIWQAVSQRARQEESGLLSLEGAERSEAAPHSPAPNGRVLREILEKALGSLPERERRVLRLRYGLDLAPPASGVEAGRRLGVSRERVRQLEVAALGRLRRSARPLGLEDLLD